MCQKNKPSLKDTFSLCKSGTGVYKFVGYFVGAWEPGIVNILWRPWKGQTGADSTAEMQT